MTGWEIFSVRSPIADRRVFFKRTGFAGGVPQGKRNFSVCPQALLCKIRTQSPFYLRKEQTVQGKRVLQAGCQLEKGASLFVRKRCYTGFASLCRQGNRLFNKPDAGAEWKERVRELEKVNCAAAISDPLLADGLRSVSRDLNRNCLRLCAQQMVLFDRSKEAGSSGVFIQIDAWPDIPARRNQPAGIGGMEFVCLILTASTRT